LNNIYTCGKKKGFLYSKAMKPVIQESIAAPLSHIWHGPEVTSGAVEITVPIASALSRGGYDYNPFPT
jgi:hypothetical protein